ncbi:hypothetical protein K491DRAFT_509445 [Lophiostoma macrostomum CBS 122681]|uniref:Uncharacterized protein n=1 Tax=Lophiostoma macrostomum CBS 122681 TaxID=1314788 RepID=A0A6A6T1N8_9PLEO|nr:hypothetical protein K491DRAFT_509445 [Lophiostoma macrostomum CBS 122681]
MANRNSTYSHYLNDRVDWQNGPKVRGGFGIVWSCLAVIITCTWTTLHLNVPHLRDGFWTTLTRKIKWMFIMVLFPEFVFSHAVVELKMALDDMILFAANQERSDALSYHHHRWCAHVGLMTRLIQKGLSIGSALLVPTVTVRPSEPDDRDENDAIGRSETPLSGEEREEVDQYENSTSNEKSDPEPLARHQRTCLEHDSCEWTLTHSYFANMGGISVPSREGRNAYVTVQGEFFVLDTHQAPRLLAMNHFTREEVLDKSKADYFIRVLWMIQILRLVIELIARAAYHLPITQLEIIAGSFAALSFLTVLVQIKKPQDIGKPIILKGELFQTGGLLPTSIYSVYLRREIKATHDAQEWSTGRIPNDNFRATQPFRNLFSAMLSLSTVAFGVIHLVAWDFEFPSVTEKWVWRICALASALLPLLILLVTVAVLDPIFITRKRQLYKHWDTARSYKSRITSTLSARYRENNPLHPRFHSLDRDLDPRHVHRVTRVLDWLDALEHDLRHRYPYQYRRLAPGAVFEDVLSMRGACERTLRISATIARLSRAFDWVQIVTIVVYLLARLALVAIAFSSFRSAPRGVYVDTWTAFTPSVQ